MNKTIHLYLIRHGKTSGNLEKRYIGITDESLCKEGVEEILALKEKIKGQIGPKDMIYASPMKRCMESAKLLFPEYEIGVIEEFKEIDFGDFENLNYIDLSENMDYQKWIDSNGSLPFPNGESRETFVNRCVSGFVKLIHGINCTENGTNIYLVVHGGTIMSMLSDKLSGDYYDYQIANGEIYHLTGMKNDNETDFLWSGELLIL